MDAESLDADTCCVAEVMATEIVTLPADTAVSSARRVVREKGAEQALVMDEGTLAGIVCRSDLQKAAQDDPVAACMSSPVICVPPDTSLRDAAEIMDANDLECLPVVTGAFLVGIVTRSDLEGVGLDSPAASVGDCEVCGSAEDVAIAETSEDASWSLSLCALCRGRLTHGRREAQRLA
jgi:CBS-domain-containing membrane protein